MYIHTYVYTYMCIYTLRTCTRLRAAIESCFVGIRPQNKVRCSGPLGGSHNKNQFSLQAPKQTPLANRAGNYLAKR